MIADETCCPDKYSQENGSLKSYNSLMRALKILTSHDFFSGDGNSACNNCFLVRSPCSDNRKLLQGLSANICLPCLGQVWLQAINKHLIECISPMTKKQILDYLSLKKQSEHSETEQASSGQREVPFSSLDKDKAHAESDTSEEEREMNKFLDKRIITTDRLKNMINIKVKYNAFYKLVERIKDCYVHSGSYTPKDAIKAYNEIKQSFEDMQYDKTIKDWCKRLEFPFAQSNTYSFQAVMDRRKKYTERVYQSLS